MKSITIKFPGNLVAFIDEEKIYISRFVQQSLTYEILKRGSNVIDNYNRFYWLLLASIGNFLASIGNFYP